MRSGYRAFRRFRRLIATRVERDAAVLKKPRGPCEVSKSRNAAAAKNERVRKFAKTVAPNPPIRSIGTSARDFLAISLPAPPKTRARHSVSARRPDEGVVPDREKSSRKPVRRRHNENADVRHEFRGVVFVHKNPKQKQTLVSFTTVQSIASPFLVGPKRRCLICLPLPSCRGSSPREDFIIGTGLGGRGSISSGNSFALSVRLDTSVVNSTSRFARHDNFGFVKRRKSLPPPIHHN